MALIRDPVYQRSFIRKNTDSKIIEADLAYLSLRYIRICIQTDVDLPEIGQSTHTDLPEVVTLNTQIHMRSYHKTRRFIGDCINEHTDLQEIV